jgi:hypothetical protein
MLATGSVAIEGSSPLALDAAFPGIDGSEAAGAVSGLVSVLSGPPVARDSGLPGAPDLLSADAAPAAGAVVATDGFAPASATPWIPVFAPSRSGWADVAGAASAAGAFVVVRRCAVVFFAVVELFAAVFFDGVDFFAMIGVVLLVLVARRAWSRVEDGQAGDQSSTEAVAGGTATGLRMMAASGGSVSTRESGRFIQLTGSVR